MKFVGLNGYINEDSSFIQIEIKNGENHNSIGDQMWISNDGTIMEISDMADEDVYDDTIALFEHSSQTAFRGAMRRMGVTW